MKLHEIINAMEKGESFEVQAGAERRRVRLTSSGTMVQMWKPSGWVELSLSAAMGAEYYPSAEEKSVAIRSLDKDPTNRISIVWRAELSVHEPGLPPDWVLDVLRDGIQDQVERGLAFAPVILHSASIEANVVSAASLKRREARKARSQ